MKTTADSGTEPGQVVKAARWLRFSITSCLIWVMKIFGSGIWRHSSKEMLNTDDHMRKSWQDTEIDPELLHRQKCRSLLEEIFRTEPEIVNIAARTAYRFFDVSVE